MFKEICVRFYTTSLFAVDFTTATYREVGTLDQCSTQIVVSNNMRRHMPSLVSFQAVVSGCTALLCADGKTLRSQNNNHMQHNR